MTRHSLRRFYLLAAVLVALTACVHFAVNDYEGPASDDRLRQFYYLLGFLIAVWLVTDPALPSLERPSFDHVLQHLMFFPLLAIYEQVANHRWKGAATLVGLLSLLAAPTLVFYMTG